MPENSVQFTTIITHESRIWTWPRRLFYRMLSWFIYGICMLLALPIMYFAVNIHSAVVDSLPDWIWQISGLKTGLLFGFVICCFLPFVPMIVFVLPTLGQHFFLRGVARLALPDNLDGVHAFPSRLVVQEPGTEPPDSEYTRLGNIGLLVVTKGGAAFFGDEMQIDIPLRSIDFILGTLAVWSVRSWMSDIIITVRTEFGDRDFEIYPIGRWTRSSLRDQQDALCRAFESECARTVMPSACPINRSQCAHCRRGGLTYYPIWGIRFRGAFNTVKHAVWYLVTGRG